MRVTRFLPRYKYIRNEKNLNLKSFSEDFSTLPLNVIYGLESPDDMIESLNKLTKDCIDRHAPLRRVKVTRPPAPWLADHEIRELQSQRNELRKKAHESDDPSLWDAFRSVRNNLKTKIRRVKKAFFENAFSSRRPREIWKTIHRVLNPCPKPLRANPNDLNAFFSTTAERTLGRTVDNSDILDLISELDTNHEKCTFDLREVTQAEVLQEIKGLRADCSTGPDQMPVKFLKPVAESLAGPLTYIINSCIKASYFPEAWKIARISPIPKVNQPKTEHDYRPISILPALSKVFERLVSHQVNAYIKDLALFNDSITGFRKGHSTTTTLLGIRDDIMRAMRRGEVTLMVLADYSKAFDTINFKSVIHKMHSMGFS